MQSRASWPVFGRITGDIASRVVIAALLFSEESLELRAELFRSRHLLTACQQALPVGGERVVLLLQGPHHFGHLGRSLDLTRNLQVGAPGGFRNASAGSTSPVARCTDSSSVTAAAGYAGWAR